MQAHRVFNLGSVNIDLVYAVPHFVRPGETLTSTGFSRGAGGKGYNQSIALARAGTSVSHIGRIGADGVWLKDLLTKEGADTECLSLSEEPTGHALIQVSPAGENAILLHPGANHALTENDVEEALASSRPGDFFLCQNETSAVDFALGLAKAKRMYTVCNAAPAHPLLSHATLTNIDLLLVNETEAMALASGNSPEESLRSLRTKYPHLTVVLTLGAQGVVWSGPSEEIRVQARVVPVVDTTAAGDTFAGYLLTSLTCGSTPSEALTLATRAAALCVTRPGAATSIPFQHELG